MFVNEITCTYEHDVAVIAIPEDLAWCLPELRDMTGVQRGGGTRYFGIDGAGNKGLTLESLCYLEETARELRAEGGWLAFAAGWAVDAAAPPYTGRHLSALELARRDVPAYPTVSAAIAADGAPTDHPKETPLSRF